MVKRCRTSIKVRTVETETLSSHELELLKKKKKN